MLVGDVGRCLPGGDVEGQLVHDRLQRIGRRHLGERCIVGAGDAAVHGCRGGVVGQLEVHGGRRALAVDLHLQGVQGGLVGFGGQALGQAGVDGHEAGSVGQDGALDGCEVAGQSVRGQVRSCGQGGHLALQRGDGGGVDSDGGGVCRVLCLRGVGREDRGQLSCGNTLELYDWRLRDAVVQDPSR